jgi:hypothetical protein
MSKNNKSIAILVHLKTRFSKRYLKRSMITKESKSYSNPCQNLPQRIPMGTGTLEEWLEEGLDQVITR